jgi:SAM-dependent methyltransferase
MTWKENLVTQTQLGKEEEVLKLDFGCGPNKREGFLGVDNIDFKDADGNSKVDFVLDIVNDKWPWKENTVDEIHCSHFLEHLTGKERIDFFNKIYTILKPKGKVTIITPHWSHERAYGDPTHQWPPVTGWLYLYLIRDWRANNAPHVGYTCNFTHNLIGTHDPNDAWVSLRNLETKGVLMTRNINTTTDLVAHLVKED